MNKNIKKIKAIIFVVLYNIFVTCIIYWSSQMSNKRQSHSWNNICHINNVVSPFSISSSSCK